MNGHASVVESFFFRGRHFFVKRDDRIDPLLSGNKYRKLYRLLETPAHHYHTLWSRGGAQSNAMLALAALCQRKGWRFHYMTRHLPDHLRQRPCGNLRKALELGMQLHEASNPDVWQPPRDDGVLVVPQGGADPLAQDGIALLAEEIQCWQQQSDIRSLHVALPAGTGTTAFYLAAALPDVCVLTTPVVGDAAYLQWQMEQLGAVSKNLRIIEPDRPCRFAFPCRELLAMYLELKAAGIEFDLIYGSLMWHTLLQHIGRIESPVLYVHSGGLSGNDTMLARYQRAGLY